MPLYSTQSGFYRENFPSTSLMDKAHKLLASISSGDYGLKMITSVTNRATQTPQRRGVLICPIEPYDSDDEPPVKKQRNAKYQLRFVNRVCNDYYTREQIKSEDGNILKVALYDENNLVVTSGPLSSASVEVVLLHGDFNAEGQDYWTSEEFSACLVHPQSVKESPALGGDRALALTDGEAELGNAYFQSSSFHARTGKFKMGAEIKSVREESVQEGITSPFLVRVRQGKDLRSKEERTTMQGAPADSLGAAEAAARPSRYDSQKRRDWNTFRQYLRNHRPPLELSRFSGAHVLEFLRYLDQFGKTKVHAAGCHSFGHPSSLAACPCPLRQAWGSLDALVGRLRAAFEEHGGQPEANPFGARAVRIYLREVRDSQAKARGIRMPKAVMPEKE